MALTQVVFADVSVLNVAGNPVEACTSFQASRNVNTRVIEAFNNTEPVLVVSSKSPGNGSFSYTVSDGDQSGVEAWKTIISGTGIVVACVGNSGPATGTAITVSLSGCSYAGQSLGMNAQNEMTCTVNFGFASGSI